MAPRTPPVLTTRLETIAPGEGKKKETLRQAGHFRKICGVGGLCQHIEHYRRFYSIL